MLCESHSITRGSQKHVLIAVFIFITAHALETLNAAVCWLIEKLWPLPHCSLSNFREGHKMPMLLDHRGENAHILLHIASPLRIYEQE